MSESSQPSPQNVFSPFQRKLLTTGLSALAGLVVMGTLLLGFLALRSLVVTFQHVILPLAIAAIIATLMAPLVRVLEKYLRVNRLSAVLLLYLGGMLGLGVAGAVLLPPILRETMELLRGLPGLFENLMDWLGGSLPPLYEWLGEKLEQPPEEALQAWLAANSEMIFAGLQNVGASSGLIFSGVGGTFTWLAAYIIIPIYLFFLLNKKGDTWTDLKEQIEFLPADRRDDLIFLIRQFCDILIAFFRGQIIIAVLLGIFLAVGFGLVGLQFGILLGLFLGLLNVIPYLGTTLGLLTALPIAYFQDEGGWTLVGLSLLVFVLGQVLVDYLLTPRIVGDKVGMSPMLVIFSVFFWGTALGGITGMLLAIPLTAFFLVFWRLAREKYLPRAGEAAES